MKLGNMPKSAEHAVIGQRYWHLSIGNPVPQRYLDGGWRAFEFVVFKKYSIHPPAEAMPYSFRIAFAYWLPFFKI